MHWSNLVVHKISCMGIPHCQGNSESYIPVPKETTSFHVVVGRFNLVGLCTNFVFRESYSLTISSTKLYSLSGEQVAPPKVSSMMF